MERRWVDRPGRGPDEPRTTSTPSRRLFLAALGTSGAVATAGCLGGVSSRLPFGSSGANATPAPSREPSISETYRDVELPVPESELARGAAKDTFPSITEPAFGPDWSGVAPDLVDENLVIGVERDGIARAYPLKMLNLHEVVNDLLGGPLLVTYCPLCASGIVADRTVNGEVLTFGVSGLLWRSDLVMYDEGTGSLWSQLLAQAIRGELTGTQLALYPSTITTWGQWRESHPGTEVLLPTPVSKTIRGEVHLHYDQSRYAGYDTSRRIGIGTHGETDDRLHPKTQVIGVAHDGVARAYPLTALAKTGVVNDTVGGLPVVVAAVDTTLVAYERRVGARVLTFERDGDRLVGGGSRWDPLSGRALDGPDEGERLTIANDRSPMFWFAWVDFFPDSEIYGQ